MLSPAATPAEAPGKSRWGEHSIAHEARQHAIASVAQMNSALQTFKSWQIEICGGCTKELTELSLPQLQTRLTRFASEARQSNGQRYKRQSFLSLFRALQRCLSLDYQQVYHNTGTLPDRGKVNIFEDVGFAAMKNTINCHLELYVLTSHYCFK